MRRLGWILGAGATVGSSQGPLMMAEGSHGQIVHSGSTNPTAGGHSYRVQGGRILTGPSLNIAWQLSDIPGDVGKSIAPSLLTSSSKIVSRPAVGLRGLRHLTR